MSDQRVKLRTIDYSTVPPREGEVLKDNIQQAISACSMLSHKHEILDITEVVSGKVYTKSDILLMIKQNKGL